MEESRILAIDYGKKRIGLAITDPLKLFAIPHSTIPNDSKTINYLALLIKEKFVSEVILGNPVKESVEDSELSKEIRKFKEDLEQFCSIETTLVDERYSSEIAFRRIIETTPSKKKRRNKSLIDKNAAAIILEDYLKMQNNT
ncbi:MAG: Holliday junction resolvase RuvX [Melioribacteraceae bacterium]|nr:Holliday junction resolvase RuvX [Melioribacteraceae bacterium]